MIERLSWTDGTRNVRDSILLLRNSWARVNSVWPSNRLSVWPSFFLGRNQDSEKNQWRATNHSSRHDGSFVLTSHSHRTTLRSRTHYRIDQLKNRSDHTVWHTPHSLPTRRSWPCSWRHCLSKLGQWVCSLHSVWTPDQTSAVPRLPGGWTASTACPWKDEQKHKTTVHSPKFALISWAVGMFNSTSGKTFFYQCPQNQFLTQITNSNWEEPKCSNRFCIHYNATLGNDYSPSVTRVSESLS